METKKLLLTGAAAFVAAGALAAAPVHAEEIADSATGKTVVTYNNLNGDISDSGVWMVTFPASIEFTDEKLKDVQLPLELIGHNGYTLADLNPNLIVHVKAKSEHGYKLYLDDDAAEASVEYSVTYGTITTDKDTNQTNPVKVADLSPVDDPDTNKTTKVIGLATMGEKPTTKGMYKDTITYSISHEGAELK